MNLNKILKVSTNIQTKSLSVSKLFGTSTDVDSTASKRILILKKKLLEEKKLTYRSLLLSLEKKEDKDNGIFQGLLGALGLGGLARGLRGLKPPKGSAPPVVRPTRGLGRLGRLGRFGGRLRGPGPLSLLFAGLDYAGRRGDGQTQTQAISGTAAGTAGAIAGGVIGQALIPIPGVGFVAGSLLGGMLGGAISDKVTGVDERLKEEERRVILVGAPTLFSGSLDKFDAVINKFARYADGLSEACGCDELLEIPEYKDADFSSLKPVPGIPGRDPVTPRNTFLDGFLERLGVDDRGMEGFYERYYEQPDATDKLFEQFNVNPAFRPLIEAIIQGIVMGAGRGRGRFMKPPVIKPPLAKPGSSVIITPPPKTTTPVTPVTPRRIQKRLPQRQVKPEIDKTFQQNTPRDLRGDDAATRAQQDALRDMRNLDAKNTEFVRDLMGRKPTGGVKPEQGPQQRPEVTRFNDGNVLSSEPLRKLEGRLQQEYPGQNIQDLLNPKRPSLKQQLKNVKQYGDQSSILFDSNNTIINGGGSTGGGGTIAFVNIDPSEVADKYTQMLQASRFG